MLPRAIGLVGVRCGWRPCCPWRCLGLVFFHVAKRPQKSRSQSIMITMGTLIRSDICIGLYGTPLGQCRTPPLPFGLRAFGHWAQRVEPKTGPAEGLKWILSFPASSASSPASPLPPSPSSSFSPREPSQPIMPARTNGPPGDLCGWRCPCPGRHSAPCWQWRRSARSPRWLWPPRRRPTLPLPPSSNHRGGSY